LALCHAIEDCCPELQIGLKWPNDLVVLRAGIPGKLAGILCERAANGAVVVGIGLNVDPRWDADRESLLLAIGRIYPPTSLAEHGTAPDFMTLLDGIRRYLLEAAGMVQAGQWHRIIDSWRVRDVLCGRAVVVATGSESLSGTSTGIDDQGRLTLSRSEGPVALTSGSITTW
jgi:BirA family biotin operon repressor/biotin-[acetyl-CoA-carboxylase] ligase